MKSNASELVSLEASSFSTSSSSSVSDSENDNDKEHMDKNKHDNISQNSKKRDVTKRIQNRWRSFLTNKCTIESMDNENDSNDLIDSKRKEKTTNILTDFTTESPLFQNCADTRPSLLQPNATIMPPMNNCKDYDNSISNQDEKSHNESNLDFAQFQYSNTTSKGSKCQLPLPHHDNQSSFLQSYIEIIRKYRPLFYLFESTMSKIILYATPSSFQHTTTATALTNTTNKRFWLLEPEIAYAILNLFTLINNIIFYGSNTSHYGVTATTTKTTVPYPFILRAILTGLDCVQPAIEQMASFANLAKITQSPMTPFHHYPFQSSCEYQYAIMEQKQHPPWNTIHYLESIKTTLRAALLLSYHYHIKRNINNTDNIIHQYGILQDGGIILPGTDDKEDHNMNAMEVKRQTEEMRRKTLLNGYVGRRTGFNKQTCQIHQKSNWRQFITTQMIPPTLILLGDFLHIFRPLYYAKSQQQHHSTINSTLSKGFIPKTNHSTLFRHWLVSLLMDLLSQKFIQIGIDCHHKTMKTQQLTSTRTKDEIQRRKQRLLLYLLRSPMWYLMTEPILLKFVDHIVGRYIGGYIRNILLCWKQHHFMMD